jgi:flagellar FlgN protein
MSAPLVAPPLALVPTGVVAAGLAGEVLTHLEAQIASARHLLEIVLGQGAAIRARDVESTLAFVAGLQREMHRRTVLDDDRSALLTRAASSLGILPAEVTIERLAAVLGPHADQVRALSAELRGLLDEVRRQHDLNRALMRQEMTFLDHLTRLIGHEPEAGYGPGGVSRTSRPPAVHRVLDARA